MLRRHFLNLAVWGSGTLALAACQGATTAGEKAAARREIDAGIQPTLQQLVNEIPEARANLDRSIGRLVFPAVTRAGLGVGGQYGRGALLNPQGATLGYYSIGGGSVGLQIGAETRSIVVLFFDQETMRQFVLNSRFTFGANASISTPQKGEGATARNTDLSMATYVFGQSGFLLNASLEGAEIARLDLM
jgi:lipid-binding SYLF domain-containing protein